MRLVAGVDSSTQSCKVVIREAETGLLVRQGSAAHPDGTEVDPEHWWVALQSAVAQAGGLDDVAGISVGGQQHGMVCLDDTGRVVRPALLWNDTRSAGAAADLTAELGAETWARQVGSVPVASLTVAKLRWLAETEPANAASVAAVALPHDWLTWRLAGHGPGGSVDALVTDRSDASGTGYWSPVAGAYCVDLVERALGRADIVLPSVLGPADVAGQSPSGIALGPGCGDNAGAALGLACSPGDAIVSIGTSGVACAITTEPTADATGTVAGFADASGRFLPLVATLNAARVLTAVASLLGVTMDELSRLALAGPAGADGLVLLPYFEGERTPNRPAAKGALHGLTLRTADAAHVARAAVEGLLCGLADALDALAGQGVAIERIVLVGGGARSAAVRRIAPTVLGRPVVVPRSGQYVADGAARQVAWAISGAAEPPTWDRVGDETYDAPEEAAVRERYAEVRDLVEG